MQKQQSITLTFKKNDPLWDECPEMGPEGLIGTMENDEKLKQAIKESIRDRKNKLRVPSDLLTNYDNPRTQE